VNESAGSLQVEQSLTGNASAVSLHRFTGVLLLFLTAAQAVLAIAIRIRKICPAWVLLSADVADAMIAITKKHSASCKVVGMCG
jgi:hypothetical protein